MLMTAAADAFLLIYMGGNAPSDLDRLFRADGDAGAAGDALFADLGNAGCFCHKYPPKISLLFKQLSK